MISKRITYFIYYFIYVTILFFNAGFIMAKGIDPVTVGYVFSMSTFASILVMMIFSFIIDKQYVTAKLGFIIMLAVSGLGILMFTASANSTIILIGYAMATAFYVAQPAIIDSLVLSTTPTEQYSKIRSYGSIGAAISYFSSSYILGEMDFSYLMYFLVFLMFVLMFVISKIESGDKPHKVHYLHGIKESLKKRNILIILIITFLTYGVVKADDPFTVQYNFEYAHLTAATVGLVGLISIMFEAAVMNFFEKVHQKFNFKIIITISILTLSAIFYTKYAFYDFPMIVNIGNVMLGLFVGLFIPVSVSIINYEASADTKTTVLSLFQTMQSIGGSLLGLATTYYLSISGFLPSIYIFHFIVTLGAVLFVGFLKTERNE